MCLCDTQHPSVTACEAGACQPKRQCWYPLLLLARQMCHILSGKGNKHCLWLKSIIPAWACHRCTGWMHIMHACVAVRMQSTPAPSLRSAAESYAVLRPACMWLYATSRATAGRVIQNPVRHTYAQRKGLCFAQTLSGTLPHKLILQMLSGMQVTFAVRYFAEGRPLVSLKVVLQSVFLEDPGCCLSLKASRICERQISAQPASFQCLALGALVTPAIPPVCL